VYNWNKIFSDNDFRYVFKELPKTYRITPELIQALDSLQDDYIRVFGIKKQSKRVQRLKINIAKKKLEYIKTGKKLLLNDIRIMERELNESNSLIISQDTTIFDKNHVILQKWYGQKIDIKEVTVQEYNVILKVYEQENRAQRNSGRGGSK
jgi:hypothetical protein